MTIPWSSLYVNPVVVRLEDVFVLAEPLRESPYNKQEERERSYHAKMKQLNVCT